MSEEHVLSQAEVDALMTISIEDVSSAEKNSCSEPRVIDFTNQARIIRNEFPVLERLHERVSRKFSEGLYALMSREVEVSIEFYKMIKQDEYLVSLKNPSSINTIRLNPLRGKSLIVFHDTLVFLLVDNYFGGHGKGVQDQGEREFTLSELRVIKNILNILITDLKEAWNPIRNIDIELIKSEQNPQLISFNHGNDELLVTRLKCQFENASGYLDLVMPYALLEPIREQLDIGAVRSDDEIDPNWIRSLRDELLDVSLELHSTLVEKELKLSSVLALKAGDIISVEIPELITLFVENVPSFHCKFGLSRDKCALKVMNKINR